MATGGTIGGLRHHAGTRRRLRAALPAAVGSGSAAAAAEPARVTGMIEGHPGHGGDRVCVNGWTPTTYIELGIWDGPSKSTLVDSATPTTNDIGDSAEVFFADLRPGQFIVVAGGAIVKELELVTLAGVVDMFADTVSGTAPTAAESRLMPSRHAGRR